MAGMGEDATPRLFTDVWAGAAGPRGTAPDRDTCSCFDQYEVEPNRPVRFHSERQDTAAPGWLRLLELVEQAAADRRAQFVPLVELSAEERRQVITLPASIGKLTAVRHLVLYGSNLVRIPPEIGAMESLESFSAYTSRRLHWFPYELIRCAKLTRSTVSTRALYGNEKLRPQFPLLQRESAADWLDFADCEPGTWGAAAIRTCSVCNQPIGSARPVQVWVLRARRAASGGSGGQLWAMSTKRE